jgi:hypothetical protein
MSQAISPWIGDERAFDASGVLYRVTAPRWLDSSISLVCMTTWIGIVSAYDIYLTLLYAFSLEELEVNPFARSIMQLDAPADQFLSNLAFFIGLKCAGLVIVISVLYLMSFWRKHWALLAASGVSAFQFWLLLFLSFGAA